MAITQAISYPPSVNAALIGSGRNRQLLELLGRSITVPGGAQVGAITVPIISAFTAAASSDGTMLTNGYNNTVAAMTFVDNTTTLSRLPSVLKSIIYDGPSLRKIVLAMEDALAARAIDSVIEGLVAATPSSVNTLQAGHMNFTGCDQTDIAVMTKTIIDVAKNRNVSMTDLAIMMHPTAFANFSTGGSVLMNNAGKLAGTELWTFMGVPIYPVSADSATNWGAASKPCAFVVHPDGYGCKFTQPYFHGGGILHSADATSKLIINAPYAHGTIQAALLGEIANTTS